MARKSKLNPKQWDAIEKRLLAGEKCRVLAREFNVPESTIRTRLSAQTAQIKAVANQVIEAEHAFNALPAAAQITAQSLINELREISMHIAGAARYGAMTAHRLNGIAHQQLDRLDDANPLSDESIAALKSIGVYTEVANKASATALNLLAANKEAIKDQNARQPLPGGDLNESRRKLLKGVAEATDG